MAAHTTLADPPAPSSSPGSPSASDAEVDELDASGSEAGARAPRALEFEPSDGEDGGLAPGSFRAPSRRRIVRVPGHSVIPAERMEFILRADGVCAAARRARGADGVRARRPREPYVEGGVAPHIVRDRTFGALHILEARR
jgi:hypothetical protein